MAGERDDPRVIAEGLSEAQRRAIELCAASGGKIVRGAFDTGGVHLTVALNLVTKGIWHRQPINRDQDIYHFTPLGLQVRAILEEQPHG
jgi:hypothetical protein